MKTIYDKYDNQTVNVMDSAVKNALDPTPKHECHVSKTANKITSGRSYRAYERTQVKIILENIYMAALTS